MYKLDAPTPPHPTPVHPQRSGRGGLQIRTVQQNARGSKPPNNGRIPRPQPAAALHAPSQLGYPLTGRDGDGMPRSSSRSRWWPARASLRMARRTGQGMAYFVHTDQREQPKKASPRNQDKAIWPGGVGPGHGPALVGAELELHRSTHSHHTPAHPLRPPRRPISGCWNDARHRHAHVHAPAPAWRFAIRPSASPFHLCSHTRPVKFPRDLVLWSRQTWDRRCALFGSTNCGGAVSPSHSTVQPPKRTYCTVSANPKKPTPSMKCTTSHKRSPRLEKEEEIRVQPDSRSLHVSPIVSIPRCYN
ncbi:hypothetical protein EDB80DRAFT_5258 [Ilyonectria destructans]|nr:hypothetical protein EDB80DRAFT_5258 [Ilyonectria destructans]